jgi:hypothetical protein
MALPAAPGPNPGYTANNAPLVFRMTVTGPGGTGSDTITVNPRPETFSGITARYRTRGEWRVDGNSSILAGQRVTVVVGSTLTGPVVGTATVDPTGAFAIKVATPDPGTVRTISIVSATGGVQQGITLQVTN